MAFNFKKAAQKATTLSELMEGRDKLTTDDIIATYPDGITLTAVDMVAVPDKNGEMKSFPVFLFLENPSAYIYGGTVLKKIAEAWIQSFDGDIEATSTALGQAGGVKVKLAAGKTKTGNNIVTVSVV